LPPENPEENGVLPPPEPAALEPSEQERPAKAAPPAPGETAAKSRPSRILRWLFYLVWLFTVPAALALLAVRVLAPDPLAVDVGLVRKFIAEQQVPATILFFTLFAMLLWRTRYVLPFAGVAGVLGRSDLPTRMRPKYDDATQLLAEARRILHTRKHDVERALAKRERDELGKALDKLEEHMRADKIDEERFVSALVKAEQLVSDRLGRWRKGELREYTESIGVAVAVALVLRFFVIEAFKIPSGSMIPTLMIGDHIFVAKYAYGPLLPHSDTRLYSRLPPARGDVMVFKFPENKQQDFIKRVIALPGDTLEALSGRPILNGWLVPHCKVGKIDMEYGLKGYLYLEYLEDNAFLTMYDEPESGLRCQTDRDCGGAMSCRSNTCGRLQGPYHVAQNEVWVMGDNRNNSHDSRSWRGGVGGGVPFENIKGRAMFVWWSWGPRGGVAFDRIFVSVMGPPRLPPGAPPELVAGLQKCLRERPPVSETTAPAPK
jgi:signal peptidase I